MVLCKRGVVAKIEKFDKQQYVQAHILIYKACL